MVDPAASESKQEYSPLRGLEIGSSVVTTFLRGRPIFEGGSVLGEPGGQYLHRPTARP